MSSSRNFGGVDVLSSPASFHPLGKINGTSSSGLTNGFHSGSSSHPQLLCTGYGNGTTNGYGHGTSNGYGNGIGNGFSNGLAHCHDDSDEEDDFYGAEERSCGSDSDFHDARDADFSSDSDSSLSSHTPSKHQGGYRSLLLKLQEEQAKRTVLEAALQTEKQRVRDLEEAALQKARKQSVKECSHGQAAGQQESALVGKDNATGQKEAFDQSEVGLLVARMVSEAVGRAAARAEAMIELESQVQRKDQELARLREKLQYWERMNQEMSQQNTHAIEYLRQRRRMWKNVYRAACFVGAAGLGVGLVAALNFATGSHSEQSQSSTKEN